VFNANSVAVLIMSNDDHFRYLERLIHTAFNPRGSTQAQEGYWLLKLAALKLGYKLIPNN
jgi:hypothetical protein